MKKVFLTIALLSICGFHSLAQGRDVAVGDPDPARIGISTSSQELIDITVSQFEEAGYWYATMAGDMGVISIMRHQGEPLGKIELDAERLASEEKIGAPKGQYVSGVKVRFYKRALTSFAVFPIRPIPIQGKCKTVSVWVVGRNFNHRLKLIIEDFFGRRHELTMSKLNFLGWKKLTVAIPPTIIQADYHHTTAIGIKVVGFKIYCDLSETTGTFYIYFDDLSAVTDLFEENNKDTDDMADDW